MNTHHTSKRQGVALITTLMICAMLMVIVGSILAWLVTERRLSYRTAALVEARNAAEGIAEFGFSQVANLAAGNSVIFSETVEDQKVFMAGKPKALTLPSLGFFDGSHVAQTGGLAPELLAGQITKITNNSSTELYRYVSTVNNNDRDSAVRDRWVERRDIRILAKATVDRPGIGGPVTSYVEERISVRGSPLFTAAIFYNMDLELHPGPDMTIGGPVVVNGNMFVNQQGDKTLQFMGPVTVSGDLFRAWKSFTGYITTGSTSEELKGGEVKFLQSGTTTTSMKNSDGDWLDSTYGETTTWYASKYLAGSGATDQASWNALLKSTADDHFDEFSSNAQTLWNGNVKTRQERSPFAGIADYQEQTLGTTATNDDSKNAAHTIIEPVLAEGDANYDAAIEKQKYAKKAGLTIIVNPSTGALSVKAGGTTTAFTALPPAVKKLAVWNPYKESTGSPTANTGTVTGGMYDARQQTGQNLVELDYGVLRTVTTELQAGTSSIPGLTTTGWTGVVYVEVQGGPVTKPDGTLASAGTNAALRTSVRIRNGKNTSTLGTPSYGTTNPGLTIATNAPVYILGHFNADGSQVKDDASLTTKDNAREQPAAIVGDAVTILSPAWEAGSDLSKGIYTTTEDKRTNRTNFYGPGKGTYLLDGTSSEISAAIITGITPTNKNGADVGSGGAHNLLRYLEDWGDYLNTVRGSLVCLYESRVHTKRFEVSMYYRPPYRQWGLNGMFVNGTFPPGTPLSISFRRGYYRELSAQEYAAAKASF